MTVSAPPTATRLEKALCQGLSRGIINPEKFGKEFFEHIPEEAVEATGEMLRLALELFIEDATKYGAADSSRIIAALRASR